MGSDVLYDAGEEKEVNVHSLGRIDCRSGSEISRMTHEGLATREIFRKGLDLSKLPFRSIQMNRCLRSIAPKRRRESMSMHTSSGPRCELLHCRSILSLTKRKVT